MNPQEQRIADGLVDRIRQRRDTIDPELAQRIHQGLSNAPDAFYLLAQAAVAQGVQLESLQAQQTAAPQAGWQAQAPPMPPQQKPGFLESIFGPGQPSGANQNPYGQPPAYGQPQGGALQPQQPVPGQPLGSAGYQAVNANLPGANITPQPQYPQGGYGQPYGGQPQYPPAGYSNNPYPAQPQYPQQGYGAPASYPPQSPYGQPGYGQPPFPVAPAASGYPPQSGYPGAGGWAQPGGGMLSGMGGVVAGVAAGALVTGAVESVVHGYENHERREEEVAREDRRDREEHHRGFEDSSTDSDDRNFYDPVHDASRSDDASQSNFADTDTDSSNSDGDDLRDSDGSDQDDASDMGGFGGDDNS